MSTPGGIDDIASTSSSTHLEDGNTPRQQRQHHPHKSRRRWTLVEDGKLKALVAQYGDARGAQGRWQEMAACIPGRTSKDCRKRWFHSLDPSLRKGRWTQQEDRTLIAAHARLGPAWHEIARLIPGRKDDQCSKRYNEILDPAAETRLRKWTQEEDDVLSEGVQALGHRWSAISSRLTNRPPLTCRNRWRQISDKMSGAPTSPEVCLGEMAVTLPEPSSVASPSASQQQQQQQQLQPLHPQSRDQEHQSETQESPWNMAWPTQFEEGNASLLDELESFLDRAAESRRSSRTAGFLDDGRLLFYRN